MDIGKKILEKLHERAGAIHRRTSSPYEDSIVSEAFMLLNNAYSWCYTLVEDILEEIEDEGAE